MVCRLLVVLLSAAVASASEVSLGLKVSAAAHRRLSTGAEERVGAIAQSHAALESLLHAPKVVKKADQAKVVAVLEDQEKALEKNLEKLTAIDKRDKSKDEREASKKMKAHMGSKDQAMMDKFDEFSERMNKKTRLGALDVLSKLKNAVHLIKKGALTGDKGANANLNKVLESMGQMAGVSTGGNFLH